MIGGAQSLSPGLSKVISSQLYSALKDSHHSVETVLLSSNSTLLREAEEHILCMFGSKRVLPSKLFSGRGGKEIL